MERGVRVGPCLGKEEREDWWTIVRGAGKQNPEKHAADGKGSVRYPFTLWYTARRMQRNCSFYKYQRFYGCRVEAVVTWLTFSLRQDSLGLPSETILIDFNKIRQTDSLYIYKLAVDSQAVIIRLELGTLYIGRCVYYTSGSFLYSLFPIITVMLIAKAQPSSSEIHFLFYLFAWTSGTINFLKFKSGMRFQENSFVFELSFFFQVFHKNEKKSSCCGINDRWRSEKERSNGYFNWELWRLWILCETFSSMGNCRTRIAICLSQGKTWKPDRLVDTGTDTCYWDGFACDIVSCCLV